MPPALPSWASVAVCAAFVHASSAAPLVRRDADSTRLTVIGVFAFLGGGVGCVLFFWGCIRLGAWVVRPTMPARADWQGRREVRKWEAAQPAHSPPSPRPTSVQEISWPADRPGAVPLPDDGPSDFMASVVGAGVLQRRRSEADLEHLRPTDDASSIAFRPPSPVRSESDIPAPAPAYEPPPAYSTSKPPSP